MSERIESILAEMRTRSREVKEAFGGRPDGVENMLDIWAGRIEAAWNREKAAIEADALAVGGLVEAERQRVVVSKTETTTVGNAAAMREALVELTDKVLDYLHKGLIQLPLPLENATAKARAALSAPARQCDVGTAEEQSERMEKVVCSKYHGCVRCPLRKAKSKYSDCSLEWAQTPYAAEEGGAE